MPSARTPTLILLLAGLSLAFAPEGAHAQAPSCPENFTQLIHAPASLASPAVQEFKRAYADFDGISTRDNLAFIAQTLVPQRRAKPLVYFNGETAITKELNDHVFKDDKELVTAFMNFFKSELFARIQKDPVLAPRIRTRYHNFKQLRVGIEDTSLEIDERLAKAYAEAAQSFDRKIEELGLKERLLSAQGLAQDPLTWNLAGIGRSVDEADAAARHARVLGGHGLIPAQSFEQVKASLDEKLLRIETLRKRVHSALFRTRLLTPHRNGQTILAPWVIDALRKLELPPGSGPEDAITAIQKVVREKFHHAIDRDTAFALREYLAASDSFMPGLLVPERVILPIGRRGPEVVSVDFRGQNSRNIHETLAALAETARQGGDSRRALELGRAGEALATEALDARKKTFGTVIERLFGRRSGRNTFFSGDDGAHLPERPLSASEREKLVGTLARLTEPGDYRVVFVAKNSRTGAEIPAPERQNRIVAAESIEKKLRDRLSSRFGERVMARQMLASVLMPLDEGRVGYQLLLAGEEQPPALLEALRQELAKLAGAEGLEFSGIAKVAPRAL
ncbi:MAG: hypothetical protein NDJ89_19175 [Oligoflexia bacterium]|nr:hypothetical protein [Oligoflexia bacterium]